ncbi:MAG: phosphate/phosphite/phosphonate ABC transporter substrate-binding protein, partial [Gammaproteobacteria bacterium]|nr:phosphate/phosphite/phosphonate ABC transporter substrate-binding protein [Gammaproteobacteria bacterium]
KVVYRHPATWGGYQADMQRGAYDLVFDGPHFVGWRIEKAGHHVLVKLPGVFTYTAVVRKDDMRFTSMQKLFGRRFCAHPPPNLGTLIMFSEFENPSRQPSLFVVDGYREIYDALLARKCDAAMLPLQHAHKFDPKGEHTRIIFQNQPMPQQALTAGPRVNAVERKKINDALLLSPSAKEPLKYVREDYGLGKEFVPATDEEYKGQGKYLRGIQGFY